MSKKVYEVRLDCVWNWPDDGDGDHRVMGVYSTEELAIEAANKAVSEYFSRLMNQTYDKFDEWEKEYFQRYLLEAGDTLLNDKRFNISVYPHYSPLCGDIQYISIKEHEMDQDFIISRE